MNKLLKTLCLLTISFSLTACSWFYIYRPTIQQGNAYNQATINQLKPGMTQEQVRYLLGNPILTNSFNPNRWDYVYTIQPGGKLRRQKSVSLFFDRGTLQRIAVKPMMTVK